MNYMKIVCANTASKQPTKFFFVSKFIIDGLFMVKGEAAAPSLPVKPRGRSAKDAPIETEVMSAKEKEQADKAKE